MIKFLCWTTMYKKTTNTLKKNNYKHVSEFYGILTNKLFVSVPVYWIIFRADPSAIYLTHVSSIKYQSYSSQSTELFHSLLKTLRSNLCSNEAVNLLLNGDITDGQYPVVIYLFFLNMFSRKKQINTTKKKNKKLTNRPKPGWSWQTKTVMSFERRTWKL